MTLYWYSSLGVVNADISRASSDNGVCQYPFNKDNFRQKPGPTNLIDAVIYSRNRKGICFSYRIELFVVCAKSPRFIRFWNKDTWGTPVTITGLHNSILQHIISFFVERSPLGRIHPIIMLFDRFPIAYIDIMSYCIGLPRKIK